MNREIKFRALSRNTGKWMYWDAKTLGSVDDNFWLSEDQDTRGQFTGLKDKNGKEIYEGDIVRGAREFSDPSDTNEVKWNSALTGFEPFNDYDSDCGEYFKIETCEVIGNVYENPELLK